MGGTVSRGAACGPPRTVPATTVATCAMRVLVACQHGIGPNQLFTWRRLYSEGALSAVGAGEDVVPASDSRALHQQVRELQRLLDKKMVENEGERPLLQRHCGSGSELRHDGRVAVDRPRHPLVLGWLRDRLRQWRAGARRLHARLLRPRGDLLDPGSPPLAASAQPTSATCQHQSSGCPTTARPTSPPIPAHWQSSSAGWH